MFFIHGPPVSSILGTPFVPRMTSAVDWSPFSPHAATPGGLDVATGWGPTQFGCCPKTVADPPLLAADGRPRRVLLGWLQNGCSSRGTGIQDAAENYDPKFNTKGGSRSLMILIQTMHVF